MKTICCGIDLGTTNSVISFVPEGKKEPVIIYNSQGRNTTPSIVCIEGDSKVNVGDDAKNQMTMKPKETIFESKRLIGKSFKEAREEKISFPYDIAEGKGEQAVIKIGSKEYTPEQIGAFVLQKMKTDAEKALNQVIKDVVITVPAYFNDKQRQATKDAAEIAGLNVLRIINEPTAAALAYHHITGKQGTVVVYDFGGGTFDISIAKIQEGMIEVLATNGDTQLGGREVDNLIVDFVCSEFKKNHGIDIKQDAAALSRVRSASESAKHELSNVFEAEVSLPFIVMDKNNKPVHLQQKITRAQLNNMIRPLIKKTIEICARAVEDSKIVISEIDDIIAVGGSSRIPLVSEELSKMFGKKPVFAVNPDEAVALGAALQANALSGSASNSVVLLDVTPLSLGIETLGGVTTVIIPRNTTIPTKNSQIFSTAEDNQTSVMVRVLQGERKFARDNHLLGEFTLVGIPSARRGVPQIEVTFDIDVNGIVHVSAIDKATGKSSDIRISGTGKLSDQEIKRMAEEAQKYKEADEKEAELIDLRNRADHKLYSMEQSLKDYGDKVPAENKQRIEDAAVKLREAMKSDDMKDLSDAMSKFDDELMQLGEIMYKSQQQSSSEAHASDQASEQSSDSTEENK